MVKKIAFFNHKGGVSKTTTAFNVGWMLAEKGKKVLLIDADPQCNLTGLIMGYTTTDLEDYYTKNPGKNIKDGLSRAFESQPKMIEGVECVKVDDGGNLFLLPGHIKLAEYDVTLGIAQELTGSLHALRNLPGSINFLIMETAKKYNAEYIIIDMSPSLSSLNQNLLMISDYFIVPTSPDYYSVMAIDSLSSILKRWTIWAKQAQSSPVLKDANYVFPKTTPKFLGIIIQKYRKKYGVNPSKGFQHWFDEINTIVNKKLIPTLNELNIMCPKEIYPKNYCIAEIPEFNTLIAVSQESQKPVFSLNDDDIKHTGIVLDRDLENVKMFHDIFSQLTDTIIGITNDPNCP